MGDEKATKAERMTAARAIRVITDAMECWCAEYNEETGEQCGNPPTITVRNTKHDTSHNWCAEHNPGKRHYADFVDPFEGGVAAKLAAGFAAQMIFWACVWTPLSGLLAGLAATALFRREGTATA